MILIFNTYSLLEMRTFYYVYLYLRVRTEKTEKYEKKKTNKYVNGCVKSMDAVLS